MNPTSYRLLTGFAHTPLMHKKAFALGLLSMLVSIMLTVEMTELAASYANLQPLAMVTLILLVLGTVVMGYSIWDEVTGKSRPKSQQ